MTCSLSQVIVVMQVPFADWYWPSCIFVSRSSFSGFVVCWYVLYGWKFIVRFVHSENTQKNAESQCHRSNTYAKSSERAAQTGSARRTLNRCAHMMTFCPKIAYNQFFCANGMVCSCDIIFTVWSAIFSWFWTSPVLAAWLCKNGQIWRQTDSTTIKTWLFTTRDTNLAYKFFEIMAFERHLKLVSISKLWSLFC